MKLNHLLPLSLFVLASIGSPWISVPANAQTGPVRACATTPDLGSLLQEVGGDDVIVTVFARGPEDPHYLEARPSMTRALHDAELFVVVGLELEQGWAPALTASARNPKVAPGGSGHVDASTVITPRDVPTASVDRSLGDVHALGSPHYLLDPVLGVAVADLLRSHLSRLRPDRSEAFSARFNAFRTRLAGALVGPALAERYPVEKLAQLAERGKLREFLESRGESHLLSGWLGESTRWDSPPVVTDHDLWTYFAARFGLRVIGTLEPIPGIAPTTRHLEERVRQMKEQRVKVILSTPYFNQRHAQLVAKATDARIARMAHQVGAATEARTYIEMVDHNVRAVATILSEPR